MRKIGFFLVLNLVILLSQNEAFAAKKNANQAVDAKRDETRKTLAAKKEELNGSEWSVLLSSADPKGESKKDTLTFQNGQVTSQVLVKQGFNSTNYTITVPEGSDFAVWETMQTNADGGVIFIRGEWKEDVMRGIYSEQVDGGTRDMQFSTESKVAVPPTTEKKKEEQKVQLPAPVEENPPAEAEISEKVAEVATEAKAEIEASQAALADAGEAKA